MTITPYLHFPGTCRAAMQHYQTILGGTLEIMGYDQMPDAPQNLVASGAVMHSALMSPFGDLMAADTPEAAPQSGVSVTLAVPETHDGARIHAALSANGTVTQPYEATFFSPGFGMVTDQFGTDWIVMTDSNLS